MSSARNNSQAGQQRPSSYGEGEATWHPHARRHAETIGRMGFSPTREAVSIRGYPHHRPRPSDLGRAHLAHPRKMTQLLPADQIEAVERLIQRMKTANVPDASTLKALRDTRSKATVENMLDTGATWGEASGGALSFLARPDALQYLRQNDNDLGSQAKIVSESFDGYINYGEIPAPHYPWRICVILRRHKRGDLEKEFLSAWCRHFGEGYLGSRYLALVERAIKAGAFTRGEGLSISIYDYYQIDGSTSYHFNFEFLCNQCRGHIIRMPDNNVDMVTCAACGHPFGTAEQVLNKCRAIAREFMQAKGL